LLSPSSLVVCLYGVWEVGGVVVPVGVGSSVDEIRHIENDCDASVVVCEEGLVEKLNDLYYPQHKQQQHHQHQHQQHHHHRHHHHQPPEQPPPLILLYDHGHTSLTPHPHAHVNDNENESESWSEDDVIDDGGEGLAMIMYTSGTTGKPKGVEVTHSMLRHQISALSTAWGMVPTDSVLNCLPLHHTHGIVNALLLPISVGANVTLSRFEPYIVWELLVNKRVTVFTAVPTMYHRLIQSTFYFTREQMGDVEGIGEHVRLMMCGSAACPKPLKQKWEDMTGVSLLERYGMTETGMVISQKLKDTREAGYVGFPLPHVKVDIIDDDGTPILRQSLNESQIRVLDESHEPARRDARDIADDVDDIQGTLVVTGHIFEKYWGNSDRSDFTSDGWFVTGDYVSYSSRNGFTILGRNSVDIIKSGGYKLSALEIERVLLECHTVSEASVVGVTDDDLGERAAAVVVLSPTAKFQIPIPSSSSSESRLIIAPTEVVTELKKWCESHLAHYKVPREFFLWCDNALPKNAMGKVNKKEMKTMIGHVVTDRHHTTAK